MSVGHTPSRASFRSRTVAWNAGLYRKEAFQLHLLEHPQNHPPIPPSLFVLSNGACLRYRYLFQGDRQFWRTYDTKYAHDPKPNDMILSLTSARHGNNWDDPESDLQLICADFDKLPPGYNTGAPETDWRKFRKQLHRELGHRAIVTSSRSGRAKVFFCIHIDRSSSDELTVQDGLDTLRHLLPPYLFDYIDRSYSSMFETFVTRPICSALTKRLPLLAPRGGCVATYTRVDGSGKGNGKGYKPLRSYQGEIPSDFNWFINKKNSNPKARETVIRILLESKGLLSERGFDLVQTKIAEVAGTDQRNISKLLRQLQALGLECVDATWLKGTKAKTYRAKGILEQALRAIHGETRAQAPVLPAQIENGTWNEVLWNTSYHFRHAPDDFIHWVMTIPGWSAKKERMRQAYNTIKSRLRYEAKAAGTIKKAA